MGNVLDTGWELVLENFRQLDKILYTPQKMQIEKVQRARVDLVLQPEGNVPSNELNMLSSSLDLLFKSTQQIDNGSVAQVISSLQKISSDSLTAPTQVESIILSHNINSLVYYSVLRKCWSALYTIFIGSAYFGLSSWNTSPCYLRIRYARRNSDILGRYNS